MIGLSSQRISVTLSRLRLHEYGIENRSGGTPTPCICADVEEENMRGDGALEGRDEEY